MIKPTGDHLNAGSNATPAALGTAAAGTSVSYSRADHVHAMPTASQIGALTTSSVIDLAHGGTGATSATAGLAALGGVPTTALGVTVATLNGGQTLTTTQVAALTGDVVSTAGNPATTVQRVQGRDVASTTPTTGQVLTWNGTAWAPAQAANGGSGGGGVLFYFNQGTAPDNPITGIPGTPKELGRVAEVTQTTLTSGVLSTTQFDLVAGFVSDVLDPDLDYLPAGIFDFNIWCSTDANVGQPTNIRALVYKYDGSTLTLIATSGNAVCPTNGTPLQTSISLVIPQTDVALSDRLYIAIEAQASTSGRHVTLSFGDSTPSHVHTTIPAVGGTGLYKTIAGVLQSPASLLVDADVDAAAGIAQSKISGLTAALASKLTTSSIIDLAHGGTGATTQVAALAALGGIASTQLGVTGGIAQLDGNGTLRTSQVPALTSSQIAQITPASIGALSTSSIISIAQGGTGATTQVAALAALGALSSAAITTAQSNVGSSTQIPVLSVNAQGQVTALSSVAAAGGGGGGTPADVQVFATAGTFTWTKPTGARSVNIQLLGGGGGGGSGRFSSTAENRSGGGGGGGGSYLNITVPAAAFAATESVTVGAGGAGAPAQTTIGSNGQNGFAGGNTTFNSLTATGGGGGTGGTTTGGGGGYAGLNSNSGASASTSGGAGGVGAPIALTVIWNYGGAGGGAGGGVNSAGSPSGGGIGGRSIALGYAGGTAGVVGGAGGAGTSNTNAASGLLAVGSGGGGGGGGTGQGGAGAAGGFPASGGGGGGVGATTSSGAGGTGAAGMAIITTYF